LPSSCTHDAVYFKGRLSGFGYDWDFLFGYTDNNSEIFDDHFLHGAADVTRVSGSAAILAGANTVSDWSAGYFRFGLLEGSNANVAGAEGLDVGADILAGRTWTTSNVFQIESPNNFP